MDEWFAQWSYMKTKTNNAQKDTIFIQFSGMIFYEEKKKVN